MGKSLLIISALLATTFSAIAQTSYFVATYDFEETYEFSLKDANGVPIVNGATNGTGNLIQLGYFSNQVAGQSSTMFNGTFLPLFSFYTGDDASGTNQYPNGIFYNNIVFDTAPTQTVSMFDGEATEVSGPPINPFPTTAGTYLVLRWYNSHDTSGTYNTVGSPDWTWIPVNSDPSGPAIQPSEASVLYVESSGAGVAVTGAGLRAVLVPEPGFAGFALAGLGALVLVHRRRKEQVAA